MPGRTPDFDFEKFYLPAIHNAVEGAKDAADRGNVEWAHRCLDSADKLVGDAKAQVEEDIQKRRNG